uniref:Cyclase family protein n=1 Tax=uncultured Armatimonadetes bacterium TaxID=157466 RepID=A0A6J4K6M8_9BACT|nr:hypothetical protein AVDCRST_MAG63-4843 [uncultured Armatimonadetes bacterium]
MTTFSGVDAFTGGSATVYDLEQPRFDGMPVAEPHRPGYSYVLHRRHGDGYVEGSSEARTGSSGVVMMREHSGTHIDALCHQADRQTLYGGVDAAQVAGSRGYAELGVETVPPIVAAGILIDLPRHRGVDILPEREQIGAEELQRALAADGETLQPGDVALVRTGYDTLWNDSERYLAAAGVAGNASAWLAEQGVVAVGIDNMAWDVEGAFDEEHQVHLPGHILLLARAGIYIIENLDLRGLAAARAVRSTFVCTRLKLTGATGSPVSPIAIVPNAAA